MNKSNQKQRRISLGQRIAMLPINQAFSNGYKRDSAD